MRPPKNTRNYEPIPGEEWRQAVGFSEKYWVSNMGRIFTTSAHNKPNNPAIMKPARSFDKRIGSWEYYKTVLDGRTIRVHRVVATTWVPNPENKPFVNHINGNKAEALDQLGNPTAAAALRMDSAAWARYGFGPDSVVKARMRDIASVADRATKG